LPNCCDSLALPRLEPREHSFILAQGKTVSTEGKIQPLGKGVNRDLYRYFWQPGKTRTSP
jgi:hypothetical protein